MSDYDLKFNKKVVLKMLNDLLKLVQEDKIAELQYESKNDYYPQLGSDIVMFGGVKPELTSQIFTLYVRYK